MFHPNQGSLCVICIDTFTFQGYDHPVVHVSFVGQFCLNDLPKSYIQNYFNKSSQDQIKKGQR